MSAGVQGIKDITTGSFSAKAESRKDVIAIWFRGNADMAVHERLKTLLDSVDTLIKQNRLKEAVFEMQELYFMNSSCLSLLLRMINGVMEQSGHKYQIRFRSNPNLRWQKRSLQALHSYAHDVVVVE